MPITKCNHSVRDNCKKCAKFVWTKMCTTMPTNTNIINCYEMMIKSSLGISLRNAGIHVYLFWNIPLNLLRYKEHGLKFSAPHACPGNSWIFMCATSTETENLKNTKIHSWRHLLLSWMNQPSEWIVWINASMTHSLRQWLAATYWWFTFIFKSSLSLHFHPPNI